MSIKKNMSVVDVEVKKRKVVKDPKMSLTMIGRLVVASDRVKMTIIKNCKYPSEFVPGYHELARKAASDAFEGNLINDHHLYFEDFKRKATEYRKIATTFPKEKVGYKNNFYSAQGLDGLIAMSGILSPLFVNYNFHSNLSQKKSAIMLNGVRLGAMADMLLFDEYGLDQVGFLKFNFAKTKYPAEEAAVKLKVIKLFFEKNKVELNPSDCILVDVPARRIYRLDEVPDAGKTLDKATVFVRDHWDEVIL